MNKKDNSREEKIMNICEAVKGQSEAETVQDNLLLGGLRLAYDHGYADGAEMLSRSMTAEAAADMAG